MSKFLRTVGAVFLSLGIIASVVLAFNLGFDYPYSFMKVLNPARFFGILVGGLLASAITSGILFFCGDALDKLDEILSYLKNKKD